MLFRSGGEGKDVSGSEVSKLTAGTDERIMLLPFAFTSISIVLESLKI